MLKPFFGDIGSIFDEIWPPLDTTRSDVSIRNASAVDDSPVVSTGTNRDAHPKAPHASCKGVPP